MPEPQPALAHALAWRVATLPRFRALLLLRRLGGLAERHGHLPESERLAPALHEARTRAIHEASLEERIHRWGLPDTPVPAYRELEESLAAWLDALPAEALLRVMRMLPPAVATQEAERPEPEVSGGPDRTGGGPEVRRMDGREREREKAAEPDGGEAVHPEETREESAPEPEAVAPEDRGEPKEVEANGHPRRRRPRDPPERYVGTGFSAAERPDEELVGTTTLAAGEKYWFWLEISEEVPEHSIESAHVPFPRAHLGVGTRLTVVLFVVPGGLLLDSQASSGVLQACRNGSVEVKTQPAKWTGVEADAVRGTLGRRLLFPVRTPAEPGDYAMRCSIYHGQTLVQSRLVRAKVTAAPESAGDALTSTLDYTLSRTLRPGYLAGLPGHVLSLMVNRNQDGSHGFFFKGEREFQSTAAVAELKVQGMIRSGRKAMRRASWNHENEWAAGTPYRYQDGGLDAARLRDDLLELAVAGLRLYRSIVNQLADGVDRAKELRELMRKPGSVQIVNKLSPSFILPAALFYDYGKLDTGAPLDAKFELCPQFAQSLQLPGPLEEQPCFQGECPSRRERRVVCPSGFWGFRHELGMPVSIRNAPEAPLSIKVGNAPAFAMAVYRDFDERVGHEQRLKALTAGWSWEYADTRDATLELLENTRSQIVYFYCHGGMSNDAPYLLVGSDGEGLIHRETLDEDMRWTEPRPLVFINGCRTVAVEPEQAFEMVSALVESHNAAGVIGTEITVFEPLARAFAEAFFDRFLVQKRPLGEAVRGARLALLKQGNPLGLVYLPFALAGLKLEA